MSKSESRFATKNCGIDDVEICRRKGWKRGTVLVGDEGYGPTVIRITAVTEEHVMARTISHNGQPPDSDYEHTWTLSCRNWKEAR